MLNLKIDVFYKQENIYKTAFYFGFVTIAILLIIRIAIIFSYVPEITGVDNNFVYTVLRMLAGFSPYSNPEEFPYLGNIYSPLYFDICYLIGKTINVNPDIPIQVFKLCKSVSLFCDVTTMYLLYRTLIKNFSLQKEIAVFMTAIFFCIMCYLAYTFNRVDSLFLAFYALTFNLLTKEFFFKKYSNLLILAFLCNACIFSKQNGIILPILIFVYLLIVSNRQKVFGFLFCFTILFALTFITYTQLINYEFLQVYTTKGVQNKIDIEWFYINIFKPLANSFLIIPLLFGLTISAYLLLLTNKKFKSLAIVYIIQLGFSTAVSFKWGSSLGYFNEAFFIAAILISLIFLKVLNLTNKYLPVFWLLLPIILVFFVHTALQNYLFFVHKQEDKRLYYYEQKMVAEYIQPLLNNNHVLDMSNQNRDFFKTFLYKEMAAPHFDTIDCCLLPDNNFDYSKLKAELKNGNIKYIIFSKDNFDDELWGIPLTNYKKDTSIYNYDLYKHAY